MIAIEQHAAGSEASESHESKFFLPLLVIAVLAVWIVPMMTSLELDETGVWWVVKDGLRQALARARVWPLGQSLVYDSLLIGTRTLLGEGDFVLRLPSVLAMIAAVYLLYRLGTRLIGPLGAILACIVFVTMREVVYVASTMRPYALVPLLTIGAVLALMNWLDSGRLAYAAAYVMLSALAVYTNYFAGLMLPVHAVLAFERMRERTARFGLYQLLVAWGVVLAVLVPLVPFLQRLRDGRASYSYLPAPHLEDLLIGLFPPLFVGAIAALAVMLIIIQGSPAAPAVRAGSQELFLATWALLPATILWLISSFTNTKVFAPRYFIASAPAVALIAGTVFRAMHPRQFRLAVALAIVFGAAFVFDVEEGAMRGATDWRGAARAVHAYIRDARTPVLAVPSFHEGASVEGALDPLISDGVFAPYLRYDFGGTLVRVPQSFGPESEPYVERIVAEKLADKNEFFLIGMMASEPYREWLRGRCAALGLRWEWVGNYGGIGVSRFVRTERPE